MRHTEMESFCLDNRGFTEALKSEVDTFQRRPLIIRFLLLPGNTSIQLGLDIQS